MFIFEFFISWNFFKNILYLTNISHFTSSCPLFINDSFLGLMFVSHDAGVIFDI